MSVSRSRATPRGGLRRNRDSRSVEPGQAGRGPSQSGSATAPREPEWKTEQWKLHVEAEARSRLKKSIRQVGSER
jgi:hypothetical protein